MKLALGTVQLGMDYGISNSRGQVSDLEAESMLNTALDLGVELVDTAQNYGESELLLGRFLPQAIEITTKIPVASSRTYGVAEAVDTSFERLNRSHLYGVMFHNPMDLLGDESGWQYLKDLKAAGRIKKIGVSAYTVPQVERILEKYDIDILQFPLNWFDQRLITSGLSKRLKQAKVEVHARSLFLQGLLLMDDLPPWFERFSEHINGYFDTVKQTGLNKLQAALSCCAKYESEIDRFVIGCCSANQLREIVDAYRCVQNEQYDFSEYGSDIDELILPHLWDVE